MRDNFDPDHDIPQDDEEAVIAIKHGKDDLVGKNVVGIFRCKREQGMDTIKAYQYALEAALEAMEPEMYARLHAAGAVGKVKA
jgi:hypothetical protein